jgi:hypothetical protein
MAREIVTSENRDDYIAKKLKLKKEDPETGHAFDLNDRKIGVTLHPVEQRAGNEIHHVDIDKFDPAFKKTEFQYIGKGGEGGIGKRYEGIENFLKDAKSMRASEVEVNKEGGITFGDGRHRYAFLRDKGLKKIPVSMNKKSKEYAKKHGYLSADKDDDKKK